MKIVTVDSEPKRFVISRSQAKNLRTYDQMKRQATEHGGTLEILSDGEYHKLVTGEEPVDDTSKPDDDGIFTDENGRRWFIGYRGDVSRNVRRYEALKARAQSLDAELLIRPDHERPRPAA